MIRLPASIALLIIALPLGSAEIDWTLGEKSRAVLDGDSTLRAWKVEADTVHGDVSLPWTGPEVASFLQWVDRKPAEAEHHIGKTLEATPPKVDASLKIKVSELKSGNDRMERDMRNALKAKHHPWIVYTFERVRSVTLARPGTDGKPSTPSLILHTTGTLSLAGTEKEVDLDFDLAPAENGGYLLVSTKTVQMTEFGIEPPTALFGLLKAHDEVEIQYRLHLVPAEKADK